MIKVNGMKGQLTHWRINPRSAWGVFQTMDDAPTTMQVKVFASIDATEEGFAASLYNVQKNSWVVIDATLASCEVTTKLGHPIRNPETQRVMIEHFLRISDIQLISPAYATDTPHEDHEGYFPEPGRHPEPHIPAPAPAPVSHPVPAQKQAAHPAVPPPPLLRPPAKAEVVPSTQVAPAAMPWLTPR